MNTIVATDVVPDAVNLADVEVIEIDVDELENDAVYMMGTKH